MARNNTPHRQSPLAKGPYFRVALLGKVSIANFAKSRSTDLWCSVEYSFSLNFSRPAHPIIAQYFNFIHLGFEGFRSVALSDLKNARLLARALDKSGYYTVLSEVHQLVNQPGLIENTKKAVGIDEEDVEVSPIFLQREIDLHIGTRIMCLRFLS